MSLSFLITEITKNEDCLFCSCHPAGTKEYLLNKPERDLESLSY